MKHRFVPPEAPGRRRRPNTVALPLPPPPLPSPSTIDRERMQTEEMAASSPRAAQSASTQPSSNTPTSISVVDSCLRARQDLSGRILSREPIPNVLKSHPTRGSQTTPTYVASKIYAAELAPATNGHDSTAKDTAHVVRDQQQKNGSIALLLNTQKKGEERKHAMYVNVSESQDTNATCSAPLNVVMREKDASSVGQSIATFPIQSGQHVPAIDLAKEFRAHRRCVLRAKEIGGNAALHNGTPSVVDRTEMKKMEIEKAQRSKDDVKRLNNRASVIKYNAKRQKRLDSLHEERDTLALENGLLKSHARIVRKSGVLDLVEQMNNATDIKQWTQDLLEGKNKLAFLDWNKFEEEDNEEERGEVGSSAE